jgi:hypothetical protein
MRSFVVYILRLILFELYEEDEIGGTCRTHRIKKNVYVILVNQRETSVALCTDEWIFLQLILKK